ncbi:snRNA-activating protein of 50kDa MW C terminal-domain-containing protein [Roridomyces roridus]|uniref:snRNA-activating protein of 50kDa MW C terminal-domain-containing protein n=1 Tax=Roridomyces roridus TaxID=1738132 RepID=A0AAD7CFE7_9AGAR|nr:snRNA-activating protein of 50kDa MW C terminal-domain-containing protein [Roridomyces roridus]
MNNTKAQYLENQFGPPSEPIHIADFIQSTSGTVRNFPELPADIAEQCSVADIHDELAAVGNDVRLMAHMIKCHDLEIAALHMAADRRSRRRPTPRDTSNDTPEIQALQSQLDSIPLESWKLLTNSAIFMRAVKNSDQNPLLETKVTSADDGRLSADTTQAILTFTVHNKLSWRQSHVSRASSHVILSSQTLGDLYEVIPCTSNELTEEILEDGRVTGYENNAPTRPGCVMCIEGLAYGDGESEVDYADKLVEHLKTFPKDSATPLSKAPTAMHDTPLSSLSLRIGEPYWLLHHGNCEHFIVFDQIRLQHPSDRPSGYPSTTQITQPSLDNCRGCTKVPAVWSIVNDERLGESPCPMCAVCWNAMGDPKDGKVVVVPLPKYELGW